MKSFLCLSLLALVAYVRSENDQLPSDSSVHYGYDRSYGYGSHHRVDPYFGHGYVSHGHEHKHGYHHDDHYGYGPPHHGYHNYHGEPHGHYVPTYGYDYHDYGSGYAHGYDNVGKFNHFTGPFGPFGFYANFYHDK